LTKGAYTGARTVQKTCVFDLYGHIDRLAYSLNGIKFISEGSSEETKKTTEDLQEFRTSKTLAPYIINILREGMKRYYSNDLKISAPNQIPGMKKCQKGISANNAKITILITYSIKVNRKKKVYILGHQL